MAGVVCRARARLARGIRFRQFALFVAACVATAVGAVPVPVAAASPQAAGHVATPHQATPAGTAPVVDKTTREVVSLRDQYRRVYEAGGGLRYVISPSPVNYKDTSGAWQPIDDSLVADANARSWRNAANSYSLTAPFSLAAAPIRVTSGSASVSLSLAGAAGTGTATGSAVSYPNVLANTTLSVRANNATVALDLTLSNQAAPTSYVLDATVPAGVSAVDNQAGGISFMDSSGATVAEVPPAQMSDAAGATSDAVTMAATQSGRQAVITVTPDPTWLASTARSWPVTIDPDVTWPANGADTDCYIDSGTPTTNHCGTANIDVTNTTSDQQRGLINWSNLTAELPYDQLVTFANMTLTVNGTWPVGGVGSMNIYPLTRSWTTGATWNTYDGTNAWTTPGGDFGANASPSLVNCSSSSDNCNWYPYQAVQQWVDGAAAPDGFIVKEDSSGYSVAFGSGTSSVVPQLQVVTVPRMGSGQGMGTPAFKLTDRSSVSVNVANGNAMISASDLALAGTGVNVNLNRTYNSIAWTTARSEPVQSNWVLGGTTGGTLAFYAGLSQFPVYIAPDGSEYVFTSTGDGVHYNDPPGLDASLVLNGDGTYSLTDHASQTVTKFWSYGSQDTVTDRNGDTVTYSYSDQTHYDPTGITDTQGRSTSISALTNPETLVDPLGRTYKYAFAYEGGNNIYNITSYTDPDSHVTTYGYDTSGDVNQITDAVGNEVLLNYTWLGGPYFSPELTSLVFVTDKIHGTGPTYTFSYHPGSASSPNSGYTTVTDPNNHNTTYHYDAFDRVTSVTDGNGNKPQTLSFNSQNKPLTSYDQVDGSTNPTNYAYATNNLTSNITAPYQFSGDTRAQQAYLYDLTGSSGVTGYQYLPTSAISPPSNTSDTNGECTAYTYDPAGNVTEVSPGHGLSGSTTNCDGATSPILYQYGRQGDTLNGSSVSCTGAKPGQICYTKDANGNQTNFTYDTNGNLVSATPPSPQGKTTYTVDGASRVTKVVDGNGNSGTYATINAVQTGDTDWSSGNVGSVTVSLPANVTAGDAVLLMVATRAQSVTVSSVSGDGLTWTKGRAKSDGGVGDLEIWYGTGSSGGSSSVTATLSGSTTQAAAFAQEFTGVASASALDVAGDHNGNNTTETSPNLGTHQAGDVVWMATNSVSNVTAWPTSPWNSLNGPKYTNGSYYNSIAWQVGAAGQYTASWTLAANNNWDTVGVALKPGTTRSVAYTYDNGDRITQALFGGDQACVPSTGNCITYAYDADGNLKTQVDQSGTTTYSYDALNRVIEKDVPSSPANACSGYAGMRYAYDGVGNLTSYCDSGGTVTYTYDAANNLVGLAEPGGNCTPGQVVQPCTTFNYDSDERLATTGTAPNQTPAETLPISTGTVVNVGYDGAGNTDVLSYEKGLSGCATQNSSTCFVNNGYFFYLTVGSTQVDTGLLQAVSDNNATATIFRNYYDARDQLIQSQETQGGSANYLYAYDNNGNRCALAANCNSPTYTYNADNELTHGPAGNYTYDANGSELTSPTLTNLTYNPKVQTTSITPSGQSAEALGYSGGGQAERISLGTTTFANGIAGHVMESVTGSTTIYFTRLPNGQLFSMRTGGASYYYLTNWQGTVLGLIDNTGSRTNGATYSYDPYGQQLTSSGNEKAINTYGYASGYYDSNAKVLQFGQRYYDPATGRWTQLDPSGQTPGYVYSGNDPSTRIDPSGEWDFYTIIWGLIGCLSYRLENTAGMTVGAKIAIYLQYLACQATSESLGIPRVISLGATAAGGFTPEDLNPLGEEARYGALIASREP